MTKLEEAALQSLQTRYAAAFAATGTDAPSVLYHYTSAAGLVGIITSQTLRATNFAYLNDSAEIRYGCDLVESIFGEQEHEKGDHRYPDLHLRQRKVLKAIGEHIQYYLTCFCTQPNLLSQWRAYGTRGGRFCLGVKIPIVLKNRKPYVLQEVRYTRDSQRARIRKVLDLAGEAIDAAADAESDPPGHEFFDQLEDHETTQLMAELSAFKHPAFDGESEWRAVLIGSSRSPVEFDCSSGMLRPFVDLWDTRKNPADPPVIQLTQVVVGPSPVAEQSVQAVKQLLRQNGYSSEVIVTESGIPFRDL